MKTYWLADKMDTFTVIYGHRVQYAKEQKKYKEKKILEEKTCTKHKTQKYEDFKISNGEYRSSNGKHTSVDSSVKRWYNKNKLLVFVNVISIILLCIVYFNVTFYSI